MGNSRTETVNGQDITIFEDSREDLQDFLGMAQEIESLGEEDQKKRIEEIFGEQKSKKREKRKRKKRICRRKFSSEKTKLKAGKAPEQIQMWH